MEFDLGTIITLAITAVATFAGGAWAIIKSKLAKAIKLGTEAIDVAEVLEKALEDNVVDKEEIEAIKKELAEVKGAWKALSTKEK